MRVVLRAQLLLADYASVIVVSPPVQVFRGLRCMLLIYDCASLRGQECGKG